MLLRPGIRDRLLMQGLLTVMVALVLVVTVVSVALWQLGWRNARERLTQATQVVAQSLATRMSVIKESASNIAEDKELVGKTGFLQDNAGRSDLREMLVVERRNLTLALGHAMAAARTGEAAIYGMDGSLLCAAIEANDHAQELWCPDDRAPGQFLRVVTSADRTPQPDDWRGAQPPVTLPARLPRALSPRPAGGCMVREKTLCVTATVPIMGLKLNPTTFAAEVVQQGELILLQPLGADFVREQCQLTGTRINVYVGDELAAGTVSECPAPALGATAAPSTDGLATSQMTFTTVDVANGSFFAAVVPLGADGVNVGSTAIMLSQEETRHSVKWVTSLTIAAGILAAILAMAVASWLSRTITKPVKILLHSATHIAQHHDLDQTIDIPREDEIGQLATAFNAMTSSLRLFYSDLQKSNEQLTREINERAKAEAELAQHRDKLEQLVGQRTAELTEANERLAEDVTRREVIERSLRDSEARFRTLVENALEAIVVVDCENRTFVDLNENTCRLFKLGREEILKKGPGDFSPPVQPDGRSSSESAAEKIARAAAGEGQRFEWTHRNALGEDIPCEVYLCRLPSSEGILLRGSMVDITERKRAEEALRESSRAAEAANCAKSEFLANMSHELRTPLTAILGFGDILLEEEAARGAPQGTIDALQIIKSNGEHLLALINDILDLSKIEAGKLVVEKIDVSPSQIVEDVISLIGVRAQAKGLPLRTQHEGLVPETIQTDPTRLRQILLNLMGNAIKFTEAGSVRLVYRFVDDTSPHMQFDIIDTGVGMSRETATRLFQPFTQADNSTTRKFGGTGLGLTVSRRLAQMLDGDVVIVRTELGVGSWFRVSVSTGALHGIRLLGPAEVGTMEPIVPEIADTGSQPLLEGCRILLAEDGPENQLLVSRLLRKAGASVTAVANGADAVDHISDALEKNEPFDLVLMDMQMPVLDGYEAARLLRRKNYGGFIIAITANAMEGDREKCRQAGCDDYISKPINRRTLIETVRRGIERARAGCADSRA